MAHSSTDPEFDVFHEKAGSTGDAVVHFTVGEGGDVMVLQGFGFTSFADVQSHMIALTGGGTLLRAPDGESILFLNEGPESIRDVTPNNFVADNFRLAGPVAHDNNGHGDVTASVVDPIDTTLVHVDLMNDHLLG
ncbi:MAG TPA: hypothetical protein VL966_16615 [Alphaproteobacteria bacterium]|jgi:hypothetical protein|nr:hypothetical protein [Alphaproteobacteria bacterium]